MDLFEHTANKHHEGAPLAERMRPRTLSEVVGQEHLLQEHQLLGTAIRSDQIPSMVLWGPPGTGKTTLAQLLANASKARFVSLSAVLSGVADLRKAIDDAREQRKLYGKRTLLFIDEIHRFNKAQQDALLPHVERGVVTLIGATTENPSFSVNAALLSRVRVFRLEPLSSSQLQGLLRRALTDHERGLGKLGLHASDDVLFAIAEACQGDARRALSVLEVAVAYASSQRRDQTLVLEDARQALSARTLLYDKSGEEHHNVISAFIKSMRGSDPDAAIYWMMRMLEAGDDPLFVLRRMVIFASEDIGNADPNALSVAVNADAAFRRLGMPEGLFPMAQCCTYLACAEKSNASYQAFTKAREAVNQHGALPVPMHLRNAPTQLMKSEGYAAGYRYPHDEGGHAAGATYLPERLIGQRYYEPTDRGAEAVLAERLRELRARTPKR